MTRDRVKVIGHRGARGLEPENTLRSFRSAMELGVDALECDVRMTRDYHAVLMHDESVARTTNGTGLVAELTLADIRALDAGHGERVPTLEELLEVVRGACELNIELKDPLALSPVLEIVTRWGVRDSVHLTSFDLALHQTLRQADQTVRTELIFGDPPPDAIERALAVGACRVSCHLRHLGRQLVADAHVHGLQVIAYPPNTAEEMRVALSYGVDLICTDRPDILGR